MVARSAGNISGEATTQLGNIFNEAMRQFESHALKNSGSSRYFAQLATDAGRQWMFIRANNPAPRKWLLHFEFTRNGATGYADGPQQ